MTDIKNYDKFVKIQPIDKGFSDDKKYYIEDINGGKLLLRVSDISELDRKKGEFDMLKRVASVGVKTNTPVDFGLCNDGKSVYQLLEWLDGEDVESALPKLGEAKQYELGIKSGELLRKIHSLPAPENAEPWGIRFRRMIKNNVEFYNAHDYKSQYAELIINYLRNNSELLDSCPQTFIHGDFWVANLIVNTDLEVGVIDFNYYNLNYGDPWFELGYTMPWEGTVFHSHFFIALFKGRFGGDPPREFFHVLKYYYAFQAMAAICDIADNHGREKEARIKDFENVVRCFGDFKDDVPSWYIKNYIN